MCRFLVKGPVLLLSAIDEWTTPVRHLWPWQLLPTLTCWPLTEITHSYSPADTLPVAIYKAQCSIPGQQRQEQAHAKSSMQPHATHRPRPTHTQETNRSSSGGGARIRPVLQQAQGCAFSASTTGCNNNDNSSCSELLADGADLGLALGWQEAAVDVGQHTTCAQQQCGATVCQGRGWVHGGCVACCPHKKAHLKRW